MDWFLYDNGLRHERVKANIKIFKNRPCAAYLSDNNNNELFFIIRSLQIKTRSVEYARKDLNRIKEVSRRN